MRKTMPLLLMAALFAGQARASYTVVLRDGTQYRAKSKWTVVNGKAIIALETGQSLALDPGLIDAAKSEQATKTGLGIAQALDLNPNLPAATAPTSNGPSLGSRVRLRTPQGAAGASKVAEAPAAAVPSASSSSGMLSQEVIGKFERAYENVGIFEHKLTASDGGSIRVELTADSEDKVFNAISATSFLMTRNAGVPGATVEKVQLFMKTTTGGSAGRFDMTRADAEALDSKKITQQDYFVRRVIY